MSRERRERAQYHPEHTPAEFDTARHGGTVTLVLVLHRVETSLSVGTQSVYHIQIHQRKQGDTIQTRRDCEDKIPAVRRSALWPSVELSFWTSPPLRHKGPPDTGSCC